MDRHQVAELFRSIPCTDVTEEDFEKLLENFADEQKIVDGFGFPAINCAAMHGNPNAVAALLKHGVDPNTRDPNDHSPLMIALRGHGAGFRRCVQILIDALVESGSKDLLDATDKQKMSAMHFAARSGECEALDRLIELGADIHRKDEKKKTPLHYAATKARFRAVQSLLNSGASVDVADREGNTPVMGCALELAHVQEAAYRRRLSSVGDVTPPPALGTSRDDKREEDWRRAVVELLLAAGADPRRTNNLGQSILMLSKKQRWLRIALGLEAEDSSSQDGEAGVMPQRSRTLSLTVPNLRHRKKRSISGGKRSKSTIEELVAQNGTQRTETPPMRDSSMEEDAFDSNPDEEKDGGSEKKELDANGKEVEKKEEEVSGRVTWPEIKKMFLMIFLFGAARYLAFQLVGMYYSYTSS